MKKMTTETKNIQKRIRVARGQEPADLVLKGAQVINVFSGEIIPGHVAIVDGVIAGVGGPYTGREERNLTGKWMAPGLMDAHLHIESSMLSPSALAKALLPHGTTVLISDPHEIANVLGLEGVRFMLADSRLVPMDIFFMAPSCVPATPLETSGAILKAEALQELQRENRILGLAEVMNFPGLLMGDEDLVEKIDLFQNQPMDGHCPLLQGQDLQAYFSTGIGSDHECTQRFEALNKLRAGAMIMIREGTSARNLDELLPLVTEKNHDRFCFVSDDLHAEDIEERGHLDHVIRRAIEQGMDPVLAVRLASINPSRHFRLWGRGAIAAGYKADLVVLKDLKSFSVDSVYKNGRLVAKEGEALPFPMPTPGGMELTLPKGLNMAPLGLHAFRIQHKGGKARIMELIPGQILTRQVFEEIPSRNGYVETDVERDLLKLALVERHHATGNVGLGMVRGLGLKQGAIASSVAHDSHNILVAGVTDEDMRLAVETLKGMCGGLAAIRGGEVLAKAPLEIGGLMTGREISVLVKELKELKGAARALGCKIPEPFMALSFLALPVIPELKLTDRGLVDVNLFQLVSLFPEG